MEKGGGALNDVMQLDDVENQASKENDGNQRGARDVPVDVRWWERC